MSPNFRALLPFNSFVLFYFLKGCFRLFYPSIFENPWVIEVSSWSIDILFIWFILDRQSMQYERMTYLQRQCWVFIWKSILVFIVIDCLIGNVHFTSHYRVYSTAVCCILILTYFVYQATLFWKKCL